MKIENVTPVKKVDKKNDKAISGKFSLKENEDNSVKNHHPISQLNELFILQEIEDDNENAREKKLVRGKKLLELLDELKLGILTEEYSEHQLEEINLVLNRGNTEYIDPELSSIIEEIELRVLVELEKIKVRRHQS